MMKMKDFLLILVLFCVSPVHGQHLLFDSYSFPEGLTSSNIQKVIQDKYRFIWVATQDGLYRFNGTSFDVLKKDRSVNSLGENFIFDICEGPKDSIFAAVFPTGIDAINIRNLQIKTVTDAHEQIAMRLPNQWVQKIFYSKGKLWAGGNDFIAVLDRQGNLPQVMTSIPGISERLDISFIKEVNDSLLIAGVRKYGIILFDPRTMAIINKLPIKMLAPTMAEESINDMCISGDSIAFCFNHHVIRGAFIRNRWQMYSGYNYLALQTMTINSLVIDSKKNIIWLGTNNGLGRIDISLNQFELIVPDPGAQRPLRDQIIANLFIDGSNNLWISSAKMLQVASLSESPFRAFSGNGSSRLLHIYTIDTLSPSEIITTGRNGLFITNILTGITRIVNGSSGLGIIHHVQKITSRRYLVSSDNGLFIWDPPANKLFSAGYLLKIYPEWAVHREKIFNNSVRIGNIFYFASDEQEGLLKWDMQKATIIQFKNGLPHSGGLPENHIHNLKLDRAGNLWLLQDKYISRFDFIKDTVTKIFTYEKNGKGPFAGIFFDLFDDGNRLWFSTYGGGINSWDKKQNDWDAITEKNGLCNNSVYSILPEKDSIIWVSTNMGLSRVNYYSRTCENYFVEDGLQDNSFDEKGYFKNGDKLYFGGVNGFTEINTGLYHSVKPGFPIYIFKMEYYKDGEKITQYNLDWKKIELPAGTHLVTLHCCALKYPGAKRINFFYRLPDLSKNYLPINETNKLDLIINSHGDYNIEISYQTESGEVYPVPLKFSFYVKPKWYQTWWFKTLIALAFVTIVYGIYRMRINQLKKEQRIRTKLASDLHDDLGSTMNSVKVYANLAIMEKQPDKYLPLIKEGSQEAITGIRDIIWVLDDKKNSLEQLLSRISLFASPLSEANHIIYKQELSDNARDHQLGQEEKRNLYMMLKEAVNNAIKYAYGKTIEIEVSVKKGKPAIQIKDDGKGFDMGKTSEGNGLKNMQRRAKEIKYDFRIESSPGSGTIVHFEKI
jgi:ligand-binding sensor domain-containing protein/anti-sigma regulatory factor (Ser/Thr protein kinase)